MFFLKQMNLSCKSVGGIVGCNIATCLEQGCSTVVVLVDNMDGYSTLLLMCGHNSLVNMMAIHPLTAIVWKQGRMNIDDSMRECCKDILRHKPQKAGQNNPIYFFLAQIGQHIAVGIEVGTTKIMTFNTQVLSTLRNICITDIIYYASHNNIVAPGEIFAYLLRVGAIAGAEDGQSESFTHTKKFYIGNVRIIDLL